MKNYRFKNKEIKLGKKKPLLLIAGPCVIEKYDTTFNIAETLKKITQSLDIPFIFKASYDKANRTSVRSFRGPGITKGLEILRSIKSELNIKVISDIHCVEDVERAGKILDIIQIPALLCRQTNLIIKAAETGRPINIKKGQFMAPWDILNAAEKAASTGNNNVMITERGAMFGYNNLVTDFRGIKIIQDAGWPVIFDATHSVQIPGGGGTCSGGQREFAPLLAKAAVAAGADGLFFEVHPNPDNALCDGPNSLYLESVHKLLQTIKEIKKIVEL